MSDAMKRDNLLTAEIDRLRARVAELEAASPDDAATSTARHTEWLTVGTDEDGDEGAETFETEDEAEHTADWWRHRGMTNVYVERHDVSTTRTVVKGEPQAAEQRSWSLPAPPPDDVTVVRIPEMYELQGGPELHRADPVEGDGLWWGPDGSLWSWSQMLGEGVVVEGAAPCARCGHTSDQHVGGDVGCLDEKCPCAVYRVPVVEGEPQAVEPPDLDYGLPAAVLVAAIEAARGAQT